MADPWTDSRRWEIHSVTPTTAIPLALREKEEKWLVGEGRGKGNLMLQGWSAGSWNIYTYI